MEPAWDSLIFLGIVAFVFFIALVWVATRLQALCPSDRILVVYGKVTSKKGVSGLAARCYHGGGAFVWPVIQDYAFLELTPRSIDIALTGALSLWEHPGEHAPSKRSPWASRPRPGVR